MTTIDTEGSRKGPDRRTGDRRIAQLPFDGPDRRQGERRSGTDRRAEPRLRLVR